MTGGWLLLGTWLSLWSFLHAEPFGTLPLPDLAGPAAAVTISHAAATEGASPVTLAKLRYTPEGILAEREIYADGTLEYRCRYRYDERGRLRERPCHHPDGSVRERRVTSYLGDRVWRHEYYYQWDILRWEEQFDHTGAGEGAGEVRVVTIAYTLDDFVGNKVIQRYVSRYARYDENRELVEVAEYTDTGYPRTRWRSAAGREVLETYIGNGVREASIERIRDGSVAVRELRYDATGEPTLELRSAYEYDAHGNWVKQVVRDPAGLFAVYTRQIEYYQ